MQWSEAELQIMFQCMGSLSPFHYSI